MLRAPIIAAFWLVATVAIADVQLKYFETSECEHKQKLDAEWIDKGSLKISASLPRN